MLIKPKTTVLSVKFHDGSFSSVTPELINESRVTRFLDDPTRLLVLKVSKKAEDGILKRYMEEWTREGLTIGGIR